MMFIESEGKALRRRVGAAVPPSVSASKADVYLNEIGGSEKYWLAKYARRPGARPAAALLVGRAAPVSKRRGHAVALIGSYAEGWLARASEGGFVSRGALLSCLMSHRKRLRALRVNPLNITTGLEQ